MKKLAVTILVLFLCSNVAFCVPAKDYKGTEPIIYDVSYNIKLRNQLEDKFHKKYFVSETRTKDGVTTIYNSPANAYGKEVEVPYAHLKKPDNYKIISK